MHPLTRPVPLRNSTVWPNYSSAETLIHVYGRCTVAPVRYDREGFFWHVCDHICGGIIGVKRKGQTETAWKEHRDIDATGHPCTFLELAERADDGDLSVTVNGKLSGKTGAAIVNPADIGGDIMTMVRGEYDSTGVDVFRRECQARGIVCAGILGDKTKTARAMLSEIAGSIGAVWSGGMPGLMRLHPMDMADTEPVWCDMDEDSVEEISSACESSDIITTLRVSYDVDHSDDTPKASMVLRAIEPRKTWGDIIEEVTLPWVSAPRVAYDVASRILDWRSRKRWTVSFSSERTAPVGGYVYLDHPACPVSGNAMILSVDFSPFERVRNYTASIPVGDSPSMELFSSSAAFEAPAIPPSELTAGAETTTILIRDASGKPVAMEAITIDGTVKKQTDSSGKVTIKTLPGKHVIMVDSTGQTMEIMV